MERYTVSDEYDKPQLVDLTAEIVAAYVSKNTIVSADLPKIIKEVHDALTHATSGTVEPIK